MRQGREEEEEDCALAASPVLPRWPPLHAWPPLPLAGSFTANACVARLPSARLHARVGRRRRSLRGASAADLSSAVSPSHRFLSIASACAVHLPFVWLCARVRRRRTRRRSMRGPHRHRFVVGLLSCSATPASPPRPWHSRCFRRRSTLGLPLAGMLRCVVYASGPLLASRFVLLSVAT
ncbi:hypothetical protein U9M48_032352 [Paspalum notatum var. saurae]|uniref:Uncharacterized protein n=1 Tax=Paspalum notatum var. saurae TaxID=547442 RepID=A0AAQ3X5C5_PASNO